MGPRSTATTEYSARSTALADQVDDIVEIALNALRGSLSPRLGDLDDQHVQLLVAAEDDLPPILVFFPDMLVVDGAHRVEAARRRGRTTVKARRFQHSRGEAEIEAVRANVRHGKPLNLAERERAAVRRLNDSPELSDRAIGRDCGLDHKTVARLRRAQGVPSDSTHRLGLDGRTRRVPQRPSTSDPSAADPLHPVPTQHAPDRPDVPSELVGTTGINGGGPMRGPAHIAMGGPQSPTDDAPALRSRWWESDSALESSVPELVHCLTTSIPPMAQLMPLVARTPISRLHEIAHEARLRAEHWSSVAKAAEECARAVKSTIAPAG